MCTGESSRLGTRGEDAGSERSWGSQATLACPWVSVSGELLEPARLDRPSRCSSKYRCWQVGLVQGGGGVLLGDPSPFTLHCSLQERRFLRMLGEAGAPELQRHETPSELLQPLIPRYEAALSQLEETVRVRARPQRGLVLGPGTRCWGRHCTKPCVLPQEERKQKAA